MRLGKVGDIVNIASQIRTKSKIPVKKDKAPSWFSQKTTTTKDKPIDGVPEKGRLSLVGLGDGLERKNEDLTQVDGQKKEEKVQPSWATVVRSYQVQRKAFSETVSMQGLDPIFDPKSSLKRKTFWFIVVFTAISFTGFNIYKQILMYIDKPISVRVDFQKAKEIQFPTVTVCNNNFASYASAQSFNAVETLQLVKPLLFFGESSRPPDFSRFDFNYFQNTEWESFYRELIQDMSEILWRCRWEDSLCNLTNFTPVFTDMGICYTFNRNGSLKAREAGRAFGLRLTLDARQFDYLRSMDHYYGAGFRVQVHSPGVPPILSEKGVAVSAGAHTFLAVEIKQLKNADPSVSHCGLKQLKYYKTIYSTEACRLECLADFVNGKCGCRDIYMPNTDIRICDPAQIYNCVFPMQDAYIKNSENRCEDQCPESCLETMYQVTASSNPFSQAFLREFSLLREISNETAQNASYWEKNLVHLEIYLASMTYEKVEKQMSYTLLQLFCDVGGAFGLLLGASLLTLLEIIDFFLCRLSSNDRPQRP